MAKTIANPDDLARDAKVLASTATERLAFARAIRKNAECVACLMEAGLTPNDLQRVKDDPDFRSRLVTLWQSGGQVPKEVALASAPAATIPLAFTESEKTAIRILGETKVTTATQYARAWGIELPPAVPIRYTEDDLTRAAKMNQAGTADWRLVYLRGLSLRAQHQLLGTNSRRPPCFRRDQNWWLKATEDEWAMQGVAGGYYVLDMSGRFPRISWSSQNEKIATLGTELAINVSRAPEQAVAEAAFTILKVTDERLLANWLHWGVSLSSGRFHVCVGRFDHDGLRVSDKVPDYAGGGHDWQVALIWKFHN